MIEIIDNVICFLNINAGAIQALSTIVLVCVTIYYSYQTRLLAKIAQKDFYNKNRPPYRNPKL